MIIGGNLEFRMQNLELRLIRLSGDQVAGYQEPGYQWQRWAQVHPTTHKERKSV